MTLSTTNACPRCSKPLSAHTNFCASCGLDISGVWGDEAALGGTVAVEMDPNVDVLGQLLSEVTLGDYDIYGELGRGGMAAVYLGLDLLLNRKVAIKTMLPELVSREGMVARFKREAQTSAALSHPHIIQIYTVKESQKLVFFVMKFIEGCSLESVINDKGGVALDLAQVLLGQVGGALTYAHRKGVVHRDIKPANIMIDEDGWAIVTDFGIAKVQEAQNLTATGTAIGTPHYMSPEQFHNKSVTGASDQYSLGIVAYEMLTGKKPFDGDTYAEIITKHLFEAPPDLRTIKPEIPKYVGDVISKMLAKAPADRYPDCEAAVHALGTPPTKQSGDAVRTQMISLAKNGPQKKVSMNVPMSPIPITKRPAAPAATAIEPQGKVKQPPRPRPLAAAEKSGGGAGKWIFLTVLLVLGAGGGGYYWKFLQPQSQTASLQPAAQLTPTDAGAGAGAGAGVGAAVPAQNYDSIRVAADKAREDSNTAMAARIALSEQATSDSLRSVRAAQSAARAAARPPASKTAANTSNITKAAVAEPAPVQQPVEQPAAPPPVAPPTPQFGEIRLGSGTPEAAFYINGSIQGFITAVKHWKIPADEPVKLTIKAEKCTMAWDTTVTVAAGSQTTIGRRFANGCTP